MRWQARHCGWGAPACWDSWPPSRRRRAAGPGLRPARGRGLAPLAAGLGLGAAFSPTTQRRAALAAVLLGTLAYLLILAAVRALLPAGAAAWAAKGAPPLPAA